MPFDPERFGAAKLVPRRRKIAVEALAEWFGGDPPEWEVRGLTAAELHHAMEAGRRQSSIESIVRAIAASGDQAQAVRRALGLTADTPGEIAKRLEALVLGSVAPTVDLPTAVKLAEAYPVEFLLLTNAITELTGQGHEVAKPPAASQTTPA